MKVVARSYGGFRIEKTALGPNKDFGLFYTIMNSPRREYVKDVFLKFNGAVIAKDYLQTIEFFSFLEMFTKKGLISGHKNDYFIAREQTKKGKTYLSLECKFTDKKYFIDLPDTKAMLNIYNQTRIGRSFTTVLISKVVLSYDGIVESEGDAINVHSDKDIDTVINNYLGGESVDNTQYFSDKISILLSTIKEEEGKLES
jgi:hypothetical protein